MERISNISNTLTRAKRAHKPVESSAEWFGFYDLIGDKAARLAKRLRPVLEAGIKDQIIGHIENASFPEEIVSMLKAQQLGEYFLGGKWGNGASEWEKVAIISELARIDASSATLLLVQMKLLGRTIELYGSDAQKEHYLPKIRDFELVGGWGLTERLNGSDASGITTNVRYEDGYYILNGNKRWIGNGNKVNFHQFSPLFQKIFLIKS